MTSIITPSPLEAEEHALFHKSIEGKVYSGHNGGISSVKFSNFHPHLFASCCT